ncbi:MAG: Holliday junction resolvase RuvX [Flavobacteriales bacterium]|nr:Holliday junction resolvase RuvX [Flavobacteriales bacterium]|tara:strand:- start:619 stop:1041 length:423 start_codon:yes stop_codon:yes gene_type:complete
MGRILGLDYGSKRVGIAETDDLKIIASPLTTVHSKDVIKYINEYAAKFDLEAVVVGMPKSLNSKDTDATHLVQQFVNLLRKKISPIQIILEDERFTSKIASQTMIMGGVKKSKRREKGNLDMVSASIILQSYLDRKAKGF